MLRVSLAPAAAIAALAFTAMPASAMVLAPANCFDLASSYCAFTSPPPPPVINSQAIADNVAAQYNAFAVANSFSKNNISLNLLPFFWEDGGDNSGFPGTVTGSGTSGTWSVNGFLIDFIAVKAGTTTFLYHVGGVSSGNWFTGNSNQDMSNIRFFGAVIPEPATWAMLILGFGLVGASLRRRKGTAHVAA